MAYDKIPKTAYNGRIKEIRLGKGEQSSNRGWGNLLSLLPF